MTFKPIKYRAHNAYDTEAASNEATIPDFGESLTVQSMTEDADINVIMKRYGITGQFPVNPRLPSYGDYTEITDFQSALHALAQAQEAFMEYPADFRAKFQNDPQVFLDFCSRPENRPAMRDLGLLKAEPEPPNAATAASAGAPSPAKPPQSSAGAGSGTT